MSTGLDGRSKLVARTERLDVDVDLLDVAGADGVLFERGRHGLAGLGEHGRLAAALGPPGEGALAIDVPRSSPADAAAAVHDALAQIEVEDAVGAPGCGPVALGALPFALAQPATLVLPRVVVGRAEDGTRWLTTIASADAPPGHHERVRDRLVEALLDGSPATGEPVPPTSYTVTSVRPPRAWTAAVADASAALRHGAANKVVLARELLIEADEPLDRGAILRRLRAAYPACMLVAHGGFVAATPELLVSRVGDIVRSHPMAGTTPRSADPTTDARLAGALLASTKDREEHRITIDMVHDTLLPFCSYLDEEAEPSVVAMANVQHLATLVEGRLSAPAASAIELMVALHPTPAVCGHPRDAALDLIASHEQLDRGRYAGPVGWVDAAGNGEWAVGIRSAELDGRTARVFAGVGVMPDSDPAAELAETQAKFQALLGAILRP